MERASLSSAAFLDHQQNTLSQYLEPVSNASSSSRLSRRQRVPQSSSHCSVSSVQCSLLRYLLSLCQARASRRASSQRASRERVRPATPSKHCPHRCCCCCGCALLPPPPPPPPVSALCSIVLRRSPHVAACSPLLPPVRVYACAPERLSA